MNIDNEFFKFLDLAPMQLRCLLMIRGIKVIIIETGSLLWLKSIYNLNLITNTYETGFNTDLHDIANKIYSNHDTEYNN